MHTVQEEEELAELDVVLLPRLGLFSRIGRGHVELHVLDLPITQAADQVVGLSTYDLPVSDEGPPHCSGANEGSPSTGPPLRDPLRTPHPRPHTPPSQSPTWWIPSPFQPLTLGASLRQTVQSPKDHL